jgi:hypothetical protein
MKPRLNLAAALLTTVLALPAVVGDEPLPQPRVVPAPAVGPTLVTYPPPPPYRVSHYAVWQNYGVNRAGQFLPRVVDTPYGAYYYYNGLPYPWVVTHPREYMPYARD